MSPTMVLVLEALKTADWHSQIGDKKILLETIQK